MAFFFDTFSDTLLVIAVLSAAAQKQLDRYPHGLSIRSIPLHSAITSKYSVGTPSLCSR